MQFDASISFGTVISTLVLIGSLAVATVSLSGRIARIEMKIAMLWTWFQKEHDIKNGADK